MKNMAVAVYNKSEGAVSLKMSVVLKEVEDAYIALRDGKAVMPARLFLDRGEFGDLLLGPAYIKGSGYFGGKVSSYSAKNENMSKLHGVYVLFNEVDGTIAGIYDSEPITAFRTGAKSAVAAKYLARKDSSVLGILGMGVQARSHIEAMKLVLPITRVLCWSRSPEKHQELIDWAKNEMGIEIEVMSPEEIAKEADILVDATYSMQPLVPDSAIRNGTLVIGLFHSGKSVQFDAVTVNRGAAYLDFRQSAEIGALANAKTPEELEKMIELKDIIGHEEYRVTQETLVYFQSGGTSIEDLAAAIAIAKES